MRGGGTRPTARRGPAGVGAWASEPSSRGYLPVRADDTASASIFAMSPASRCETAGDGCASVQPQGASRPVLGCPRPLRRVRCAAATRLARRPCQARERRRRDRARERPGAAPALQPREGRTGVVITPRPWQAEFLARHAAHPKPDFLLVATPGAGKTLAASLAIRAAGARAGRDRLPDHRVASAVGRRGRRCRAASRPALAQRGRRLASGHRRCRRDLPAGRPGAGSVRPPPCAPDVRGVGRDPSRGRSRDLGYRAPRRV